MDLPDGTKIGLLGKEEIVVKGEVKHNTINVWSGRGHCAKPMPYLTPHQY